MNHLAKYLYCIITHSQGFILDGVPAIGDETSPVYFVPRNGLAVVVSDTMQKTFEATRVNMMAHERVQERIMRDSPILPVRFGTLAEGPASAEKIQKLLEKRGKEFVQLLASIEGKAEMGIKALWKDERAILNEIVSENQAIAHLRNSLSGKPPEATHFERIRLGQMVKDALDQKKKNEASGILEPLWRIAYLTVENQVFVDRMIVNAAFLVERAAEKEFDKAVNKLDEALGQRVALKYVGPVPPYNFVNIVINWQDLED